MKKIVLLFLTFIAAGCEDTVTLSEACMGVSPLCEKIQADSNCRAEREKTIHMAYRLQVADRQQHPASTIDKMRYEQLLNLETLTQCSYLQTLIEFVPAQQKYALAERHPDGSLTETSKNKIEKYRHSVQRRKNQKRNNHFFAKRYQGALYQMTKASNDPHLLYYHWSRHQSKDALNALKVHYENGRIRSYDMLYFLSQAYGPYQPEVAHKMLLDSLTVYPPEQYTSKLPPSDKKKYSPTRDDDGRLHYPVLRNLVQLYYTQKQYRLSYLFARILFLNKDRSVHIQKIRYQLEKQVNTDALNMTADTLHHALLEGSFSTKLIPEEFYHG